jgi:hypothetical protein
MNRSSMIAWILPFAFHVASSAAQTPSQVDTIRVGSVAMRPVPLGVDDSVETVFEGRLPSGERQRRETISVRRWVTLPMDGDTVLNLQEHYLSGGPPPGSSFDYYLDRHTMAPLRYIQVTNVDSVSIRWSNGCVFGWVDLQRANRRVITCDKAADRFGASPIDDYVVAALPMLRPDLEGVLATYSFLDGAGGYAFRVVGTDTLRVAGRSFPAWRVERTVTNDWGRYVTTLWVDQTRARLLQARRQFGDRAVSTERLLNP